MVEELSQKVSEALKDGTLCLQGQPFVFKDQVCQAVKFLGPGGGDGGLLAVRL